jgi:ribosomal protein S18 acetylase RimI-like enzyme
MVTIRSAKKEDAAVMAALGAQTFYESFASQMTRQNIEKYISESFSTAKIESELSEGHSRFFLAFLADQIVGYAKVRTRNQLEQIKNKKPLELERLYVLKSYHKKKIGASLLEHCLDYATQQGFDVIWLAVWNENPKAIKFYERWGFITFDSQIFMRGNDAQTGLLMKKELVHANPS